ncbi:unnamed protein product [Ilex paraguariensis]|uniref:Uncharacterized protein n=1 Tax=Ilex paraguariensis TaxID=185542 RepID=A0ABC8QX76_9AQUA
MDRQPPALPPKNLKKYGSLALVTGPTDGIGKAFAFELARKVLSLIVVPLYVATKLASIKKNSFFVPSSTGYAQAALWWIGSEPCCTPYWPHSLIWGMVYSLPVFAVDAWRLKFCLGIRKRRQLKDSRKKE